MFSDISNLKEILFEDLVNNIEIQNIMNALNIKNQKELLFKVLNNEKVSSELNDIINNIQTVKRINEIDEETLIKEFKDITISAFINSLNNILHTRSTH
jgi:hypothetical protein